ncbi:MAG: pseudouridine synthase [Clostridia bacterium]
MQRLDKFLVNLGYGSRNEIKNIAKSGRILVNGVKVYKTDVKIDENADEIIFCGEKVIFKKDIYIMLNKKAGYVTANQDNLHKTIFDLLDEKLQKMQLFAIGRLDKDTEGLLLITNDGALSHGLMSPKKHVDKVYYAEVFGEILPEHIEKFEQGVVFEDGTKCKSAKLEIIESAEISKAYVTISEGKFHQVKIMFRTINCTVSYLKRIKIADLDLDNTLNLGEYRYLTDKEEQYLKNIAFGDKNV